MIINMLLAVLMMIMEMQSVDGDSDNGGCENDGRIINSGDSEDYAPGYVDDDGNAW